MPGAHVLVDGFSQRRTTSNPMSFKGHRLTERKQSEQQEQHLQTNDCPQRAGQIDDLRVTCLLPMCLTYTVPPGLSSRFGTARCYSSTPPGEPKQFYVTKQASTSCIFQRDLSTRYSSDTRIGRTSVAHLLVHVLLPKVLPAPSR
jgi:hypothetical protein